MPISGCPSNLQISHFRTKLRLPATLCVGFGAGWCSKRILKFLRFISSFSRLILVFLVLIALLELIWKEILHFRLGRSGTHHYLLSSADTWTLIFQTFDRKLPFVSEIIAGKNPWHFKVLIIAKCCYLNLITAEKAYCTLIGRQILVFHRSFSAPGFGPE